MKLILKYFTMGYIIVIFVHKTVSVNNFRSCFFLLSLTEQTTSLRPTLLSIILFVQYPNEFRLPIRDQYNNLFVAGLD